MNWSNDKKPLIIIAGPTAIGKSDISVKLAAKIGGEIISADSMQVYKNMDIGTAKITNEEMMGINHYLIDVLDPKEDFNIVTFQSMAKEALDLIYSKGKIPIICGGTGFYIQSVIYDTDFTMACEMDEYRKSLVSISQEKGNEYLHDLLQNVDPVSAEKIHFNDTKRVIRALEYYKQTGERISDHNLKQSQNISPYDFLLFVLTDEREKIYERIDKRVDVMIDKGLVNEVTYLKALGLDRSYVSMKGLGYKEILEYLDGEITLSEAIYKIKRDSRHFAKRQLTWFKKEKDVIWIDRNKKDENAILEEMADRINNILGD